MCPAELMRAVLLNAQAKSHLQQCLQRQQTATFELFVAVVDEVSCSHVVALCDGFAFVALQWPHDGRHLMIIM